MLVIIVTVIVIESLTVMVLRNNYYNSIKNNMENQVKYSANIYSKYYSDYTLDENILNNSDAFWNGTQAQVEIINTNGNVIMDSIGIIPDDKNMSDVTKALKGDTGSNIWWADYAKGNVMSVSCPLKSQNKVVGVLRFITSLSNIDNDIKKFAYIFSMIGICVALGLGAVAIILSNTIIGPLKEVTSVAEKMAAGNLKIRSNKSFDDEIGKLSDTLNFMADEINKNDQLKNEFISSVSHELRTPLTSIKGWAITLKDTDKDDKSTFQDGLEIIEKESDRLSAMVEELLDFSKLLSYKFTLKRELVDLNITIKEIVKELLPRAARDKIMFNIQSDELPNMITDQNRLKQLFINVLDNAFKFTETGGQVNFIIKNEGKNVVFCISDNGCGIAQDELPRVKEKFYKGKSSKSKNGIGLSICDEIVSLMNGKFVIESVLGQGTKVTITLPLEEEKN